MHVFLVLTEVGWDFFQDIIVPLELTRALLFPNPPRAFLVCLALTTMIRKRESHGSLTPSLVCGLLVVCVFSLKHLTLVFTSFNRNGVVSLSRILLIWEISFISGYSGGAGSLFESILSINF